MKSILSTTFVLLITVISSAQNKDEQKIAEAVEQLRTAMIYPDRATLEKLVSEKLSYGHSSGAVDDKKVFVEKLVSGQSDFVNIDLSDQTISISGKAAIVRHILKAKTNDGGKPGEANIRVLLIWQKEKKEWKLLARQAVKI